MYVLRESNDVVFVLKGSMMCQFILRGREFDDVHVLRGSMMMYMF